MDFEQLSLFYGSFNLMAERVEFTADILQFEYRYHTADLQIYAKGDTFLSLIANSIFAIYHYISPGRKLPGTCEASLTAASLSKAKEGTMTLLENSFESRLKIEELKDWQQIQVTGSDAGEGGDMGQYFMSCLSEALFLFHGYRFIIQKLTIESENLKQDELTFQKSSSDGDVSESEDNKDNESDELAFPDILLRCEGELWDSKKHISGTEIKAITWSNLSITYQDGTWHAYFIVDI